MEYFKEAKDWISRNWYGIIVGYFIILVLTYGAIWYFIEPMNLPDNKGFLNNFLSYRWGNHIFLSLLIAPYITLFFVIIRKKNLENQLDKLNVIFDSTTTSAFDFESVREQNWDIQNQKRIGIRAKGDFQIVNNIISLNRENSEGEFHLKLISYKNEQGKSNIIKKDITKDGMRQIQVNCQLKISGKGSQNIIFVIKDSDNGDWIANKKVCVSNIHWENMNAYFRIPYNKDVFLRIDSKEVNQPPNSVEIRNLRDYSLNCVKLQIFEMRLNSILKVND